MWRKSISDAAKSSSMACWISSSTTSNWILKFLFCGKRADRIKLSPIRGRRFLPFKNGTKTDVSNGRGPAKKQNRFLLRWLLEGLNPEQPKAVQKWLPHKSESTENP